LKTGIIAACFHKVGKQCSDKLKLKICLSMVIIIIIIIIITTTTTTTQSLLCYGLPVELLGFSYFRSF
jgi:hypothetical protein